LPAVVAPKAEPSEKVLEKRQFQEVSILFYCPYCHSIQDMGQPEGYFFQLLCFVNGHCRGFIQLDFLCLDPHSLHILAPPLEEAQPNASKWK
jgi:hypothetical protein